MKYVYNEICSYLEQKNATNVANKKHQSRFKVWCQHLNFI